jgi:hypothetical protein
MAYALFTNDEKISRAFPTRSDVWRHADEAGLVIEVPPEEGEPPRRELDQDYTIKACPPDNPSKAELGETETPAERGQHASGPSRV